MPPGLTKRRWSGIELAEASFEAEEEAEERARQEAIDRGETPLTAEFVPTDEQRKLVKDMATAGLPVGHISLMVRRPCGRPISLRTLQRHFREELFSGALQADMQAVGALFKNVLAGNVTAQIYWTKTRLGWREAPTRYEVTGKDGKDLPAGPVSGVLVIPAAPDDWESVVAEQQAKAAQLAAEELRTIDTTAVEVQRDDSAAA